MAESFAGITVPEGEPGQLQTAAHAFAGMADSLTATAADLQGMPGMLSSWQGPASVIYASSCITNATAAQNGIWACQVVAQAVLDYAGKLEDAKHDAREAIRDAKDATERIKAAEDAIQTAQARIAEATFSLNAAESEILVTGATGTPSPDAVARRDSAQATISDAADDERAARRDLEQARDDLERAKRRGERAEQDAKDAARAAAGAVAAAGDLAPRPMAPPAPPPPPPAEEKDKPWWQDVGDAVGDAASWTGDQALGVGKGVGEGVVGIGQGAYMLYRLSPTNALINRDDFDESWDGMGKAAQFAWDHPGEFGKQVANWEDLKEGRYGEWIGNLGPDAVLAVATGGAGTAVSRATRTARATKALTESADALRAARAGKAALPLTREMQGKTVGAADRLSLSGWTRTPATPEWTRATPQEVRALSDEVGHTLAPDFRDQLNRPDGFEGKFNASHAEKQQAVRAPGRPIAVDNAMCGDCQSLFTRLAEHSGKPQIVADPDVTRLFLPDGSVVTNPNPSDFPLRPFDGRAAIAAGTGSEALSATQR
jgi:hypothetical protein